MSTDFARKFGTDGDADARRVTVFHPLAADDARAVRALLAGDPVLWLPGPATPRPGGWVTRLHAGPVSHTALCAVGDSWSDAGVRWRPVTWHPADADGRVRAHDAAFPTFGGDLGIVAASAPTLVLTGSYRPPGGSVGVAADRLVLERVATATARRWLADVASRLTTTAPARATAMG